MKKYLLYAMAAMMALTVVGCGTTSTASKVKETKAAAETKETVKADRQIGSFDTVDIYGEKYTEAIFANADLTVVNVWGTFCGPCISEMPELGEWAHELPDNIQIIGVVSDVYSSDDTEKLDAARKIVETADAKFTHLISQKGDFSVIMSELVGVPTTYFVDSEGNIVGEPIIGANVAAYKKVVEDYLNSK